MRWYQEGQEAIAVRSVFPEYSVFYYLTQIFDDAENRYKTFKPYEIDAFVPCIKLGIEYDGYYFHKNRLAQDIKKNSFLLNKHNVALFRIREDGLPNIGQCFVRQRKDNVKNLSFEDNSLSMCILNLLQFILVNYGKMLNNVQASAIKRTMQTINVPKEKEQILKQYIERF